MGTLPTVCGKGAKAEAGAHFPVLPAMLFSQHRLGLGKSVIKLTSSLLSVLIISYI